MSAGLLSLIGILVGLVILVILAYKQVPLVFAGSLASIVTLLMSQTNVMDGILGPYAESFAGFVEKNFLLFLPAILFGKMLGDSGAAEDIAYAISEPILKRGTGASTLRLKWVAVMGLSAIAAILSYGGVSGFIIVFTMAPIIYEVFIKLDIPWHLVIAVLVYGATMWTAILPGSPAVQNLIPMEYLGTTPTAAGWLGIIIALWCILVGAIYMWFMLRKSENKNESFMETGAKYHTLSGGRVEDNNREHDSALKALVPSIVLIVSMNILNLDPELALTIGCLTCFILYFNKFKNINIKEMLSDAGKSTATTVINVSAVVGFGGVISSVIGFDYFLGMLDAVPGPPLVQFALATNLVAGITGSASGGEGIALEALAPTYLEMGYSPEILHRLVNISCYGLDSLPHNGSAITRLNVTHLTHEEGYYHEFWLGAIIPFFNSFIAVAIVYLFA